MRTRGCVCVCVCMYTFVRVRVFVRWGAGLCALASVRARMCVCVCMRRLWTLQHASADIRGTMDVATQAIESSRTQESSPPMNANTLERTREIPTRRKIVKAHGCWSQRWRRRSHVISIKRTCIFCKKTGDFLEYPQAIQMVSTKCTHSIYDSMNRHETLTCSHEW